MSDLFKKLNVLVKSSLNDLIRDPAGARRRAGGSPSAGPDLEREVAALRHRINEAVAFEDELKVRVAALDGEVARLDAEADAAVERGDDAAARYAVEQMQRAVQRQTMAANDLREHQLVTQELISRVNILDAAVADARRAQAEAAGKVSGESLPANRLNDVLKEARERVTRMGELLAAKDDVAAPSTEASTATSARTVEDDLARRRQRLSK